MSAKTLTLITKSKGCVQCTATHRALVKTDIFVTELNANDEANIEFGKSLGHLQAPVGIVFQDGVVIDHWSGFRPDKIDELQRDPLVERNAAERELVAA